MRSARYLVVLFLTAVFFSGCSLTDQFQQKKTELLGDPSQAVVIQYTTDLDEEVLSEIEVAYTDYGFQPAAIEITPETLVIFTNESSIRLWVRSDQSFISKRPQFDYGEGLPIGRQAGYIFRTEGEWKVTNHMNTKHDFKVVVVAEE